MASFFSYTCASCEAQAKHCICKDKKRRKGQWSKKNLDTTVRKRHCGKKRNTAMSFRNSHWLK